MSQTIKRKWQRIFIPVLLSSTSILSCTSKTKGEELISQLSAENFPACINEESYQYFETNARLCLFQKTHDAGFDQSCNLDLGKSHDLISAACREQSKETVGKVIANILSSELDSIKIADGNTLDLSHLTSWLSRAQMYFAENSRFFSSPGASETDKSYPSQKLITLLAGKLIKQVNTFNSEYPLVKQIKKLSPSGAVEPFSVISTELELLESIIETHGALSEDQINPLSKQLFGFMLSNFIESQENQIIRLGHLHDLTCELNPCTPETKPDFLLTLDIFANLNDLSKSMANSSDVKPADQLVANVIRVLIESPKGKIMSASLKSTLEDKEVKPNYLSERLKQKTQMFSAMNHNYALHQRFFQKDTHVLRYALGRESYQRIPNYLSDFGAILSKRIAEYDDNLSKWKNDLSEKIANDSDNSNLAKQTDILSLDQSNLASDLESLRNAVKEQENSLASYLAKVEALDTNKVFGYSTKLKDQVLTISKDSIRELPAAGTVSLIDRRSFAKYELKQGELFSGIIDGRWSPTCAIRKAYPQIEFEGVTAAADGFTTVKSTSGFKLESRDESYRKTQHVSLDFNVSACASANAGFNAGVGGVSKSISACLNFSTGERREWAKGNTDSEGSRLDETAAFQGGILAPGTPDPKYPAGSVLAYILPRGKLSPFDVSSVKVLERDFVLSAPEDVDVYLVVNDCLANEHGYGNLTATFDIKEPIAGKMTDYLREMHSIFAEKSKKLDDLLKEGPALSSQIQSIRSEILSEFATKNEDYASVPMVREFFEYWIDNESAKIQRKAMIIQKERELVRLTEDFERLENLKNASIQAKYLIQENFAKASNEVDFQPVGEAIDTTLDTLRNHILPLVEFHREDLSKISQAALELRSKLSLSTNQKVFAPAFSHFIENLASEIRSEQLQLPNSVDTNYVAIRFPNPETEDSRISLPKADSSRSVSMWEEIFQPKIGVSRAVDVQFNDLYPYVNSELGINAPLSGTLECFETKTVIEDMVVVLSVKQNAVGDDLMNFINETQRTSATVGPRFSFFTGENILDYTLDAQGSGSKQIMKAGIVRDSLPNYTQLFKRADLANSAAGFSPFTSFVIDGSKFRELMKVYPGLAKTVDPTIPDSASQTRYPPNVTDVILGFKVKSYKLPQNSRSNLISNCANSGS